LRAITKVVIIGSVIRSFRGQGTENVFDGLDTSAARKVCPRTLWQIARRKLDQINRVREVRELAAPPGNRLERLRRDRTGQYSIRINDQYRICFEWEDGHAHEVEITDYH
jgi:proteic killer suppression protein